MNTYTRLRELICIKLYPWIYTRKRATLSYTGILLQHSDIVYYCWPSRSEDTAHRKVLTVSIVYINNFRTFSVSRIFSWSFVTTWQISFLYLWSLDKIAIISEATFVNLSLKKRFVFTKISFQYHIAFTVGLRDDSCVARFIAVLCGVQQCVKLILLQRDFTDVFRRKHYCSQPHILTEDFTSNRRLQLASQKCYHYLFISDISFCGSAGCICYVPISIDYDNL